MAFCCLFSLYGAKHSAATLQELVFPTATGAAHFWVEEFVYTLIQAVLLIKQAKKKKNEFPILCFQTLLSTRKYLRKMHHVISFFLSPKPS